MLLQKYQDDNRVKYRGLLRCNISFCIWFKAISADGSNHELVAVHEDLYSF